MHEKRIVWDGIIVLTLCGPSCDTQAQDGIFHVGASRAEFVAACGVCGPSCDVVAQATVLHEGQMGARWDLAFVLRASKYHL